MGPGIMASGEDHSAGQLYQQQIAQTISKLLGVNYKPSHPVAPEIAPIFKRK